MTTLDDIRSICRQLPGAVEGDGRFGFGVPVKGKVKGFVWTWMERVDPKKPRQENPRVVAISVPNLVAKDGLIASNEEAFFDEPHYFGYKAVLVRLDAISPEDLKDVLIEGWRSKAPRELLAQFE